MPSAHELLAARAARVRTIRNRVIAATLAAFALAWGVVAFDGSMGTTTETAQATTTTEKPTTSTDTTTSTDQTYSDDSSADDSSTLSTGQS